MKIKIQPNTDKAAQLIIESNDHRPGGVRISILPDNSVVGGVTISVDPGMIDYIADTIKLVAIIGAIQSTELKCSR